VVYVTQLMGLAFGMSERELGLQRGFTPLQIPKAVPAQAQAVAA
jgi:heterodisulfide reductase subunit B